MLGDFVGRWSGYLPHLSLVQWNVWHLSANWLTTTFSFFFRLLCSETVFVLANNLEDIFTRLHAISVISFGQAVPCVLACNLEDIFKRLHAISVISFGQAVPCVLACNLEDIFTRLHAISVILFGQAVPCVIACNLEDIFTRYFVRSSSTLCTCLQLGRHLHTVTRNFSYFVRSSSTLCTCLQLGGYLHTVTRNFSYFVRSSSTLCTCCNLEDIFTRIHAISVISFGQAVPCVLAATWRISSHGYTQFQLFRSVKQYLVYLLQLGGYLHTVTRNFSHFVRSSCTLCNCLQLGGYLYTLFRSVKQ